MGDVVGDALLTTDPAAFGNAAKGNLTKAQEEEFLTADSRGTFWRQQEGRFRDVPKTGDNTPRFFAIVAASGILLAVMAIYRPAKRKGPERTKRILYRFLVAAFLCSSLAFAFRLTVLSRGDRFYRQVKMQKGEDTERIARDGKEYETGTASIQWQTIAQGLSDFSEEYPETAAWLQIPGTSVDYPVMQGEDNAFYLDHLPDGEKNVMGSLFLDCRSDMDSPHLIVYGHNMANGNMFGQLKKYESQEYFEAHRTITVAAEGQVYVCPIFSVRRVKEEDNAYRLAFSDQNSLKDYAAQAAAQSMYRTDVDTDSVKRVVTLSTCTVSGKQRLVVQAMIPEE